MKTEVQNQHLLQASKAPPQFPTFYAPFSRVYVARVRKTMPFLPFFGHCIAASVKSEFPYFSSPYLIHAWSQSSEIIQKYSFYNIASEASYVY